MAISPKNLYPSRVIDGDGAYPYGKALNVQNGVEGTGTPLEAEWVNDLWGSQQALLDDAGIAPNGQPDSVGNSQYLDALKGFSKPANSIVMENGETVQKFNTQSRQAIEAAYKAQGYNNVFFFDDGFTYTESNDVGIYEDGTAWTYADANALPVAIAEGTVPSEGVYKKIAINTDRGTVQDYINSTKDVVSSKRIVATAEDDSGTPDAAITVRRTHTRPNSGHGFKEDTIFNPTVDDVAYAAYDASFSTPNTNIAEMDHMVSYQSRLAHFSLGDLKYYSAVWALDRVEQGATCSNMFQFYDQGRTEGSTINHFSFVGNPLVNGSLQNYAGLRVNQPIGNPGGEIQNTLVGVYIEDLSFAGGAATYPLFIESQTNEASIGCYWRFKNRVIFEGSTIFKTSPTPDFDSTRDLGASNFRWKQFHCVTNNTQLLNLEPQNSEPTRISGSTVAMSDGTPSTNGFGTSGEGIYRCASDGQWVFVG